MNQLPGSKEIGRLGARHYNEHGLGYADFFPERHKRKLLDLAEFRRTDVFYDLGCGDASILIFAAREFGVKGVGFENDPTRNSKAKRRVRDSGLEDKITINYDMDESDLSNANVIFFMLPEAESDYEWFLERGLKRGSKLIKHDLPLIGFLPQRVDYPFYRMDFPFERAKTSNQWASAILGGKATPIEVWNELHYYQYEKRYSKWDVKRFNRILSKRFAAEANESLTQ